MNKKGIIKLSAGIFILILLLILIFSLFFSSASIKDSYFVGEEVKLDLSNYEACSLKIKTPSTTIIQDNCEDKFSLKFEEIGEYVLDIKSNEALERIKFQVYQNPEIQKEIAQVSENKQETNTINLVNYSASEIQNEKDLNQENKISEYDSLIRLGEPVKNIQILNFEGQQTAKISIPKSAENISILNNQDEEVLFKEKETIGNTIQNVFSNSNEKSLIVKDVQGEVSLEYITPGPEKIEKNISENKKEVKVSSEEGLHYQNVLSYTSIPEKLHLGEESLIKIYWKEEDSYLDFKAYDEDKNGLLDYIEWVVPHLSEQTFEISLNILNVQSYPVVGGNWEVKFETSGNETLKITPINGTNWGNDLEFLDLKCGENPVNYAWEGNSIVIQNYECNQIGFEISKVLSEGPHHLEFCFGDVCEYANNLAGKWYNSSWNHRKEIRINGTGTSLTNFQVLISTNLTDEYLGGNLNSTCKDIRFADYLANDLSFWIDSCNITGGNSNIWVKVPSIAASGNTTIFMYYGNPSANSASNGTATFDFFDDFEDGNLTDQWTIDSENQDGTVYINTTLGIGGGAALRHDPDSTQTKNAYYDTRLRTSSYKMQNGIIDYNMYISGTSRAIHQFGFRVDSLSLNNGYAWRLQSSAADGGFFEFTSGAWAAFGTSYPAISTGAWHNVQINASGSNYYSSVDGGSVYSGSDSTKATSDYLVSHVHATGTDYYVLVDNIRVRQYSSTPPNYSIYDEEQPRLGITINSPANSSTVADVTPTLNVTISGLENGQSVWYRVDNNLTNTTLCTNCIGEKTAFLYFSEGNHNVTVYANNSNGTEIFETSSFIINMSNNYYDSFDDNSSILLNNNLTWQIGNISFVVTGTSSYSSNISASNAQRVVSSSSFSNRGIATNGSVLFFNNAGTNIKVVGFDGTVLSTHTVSNLAADNNQLAYSSTSKLIYARNGANVYAINLSDDSSTLVTNANSSTKPYLTGDSWVTGTLIDLPDGRIGTIGSTTSNPFTVRLYNLSSDGLTFTWSEDISIASSWSTDNHGFASDGRFLTLIAYPTPSPGHRVYDLTTGTQYSSDSWNLMPSGIANPTYITHDQVNHRYIIGDYSDNDFVIYNDSNSGVILNLNKANFTAYFINTTSIISKISNITWQTSGTSVNNNISVEVTANGGTNWYNATNGAELEVVSGYSLGYRVLYAANQTGNISLLDMNISWSNFVPAPPNIIINFPVNSSSIKDVTPLLNISLNSTANALWYNIDNGANITWCILCSGEKTKFLYLSEGSHTVRLYTNNSLGVKSFNYTSFIINMSYSSLDDFSDNSSILFYNKINWTGNNITYVGDGAELTEPNISSSNADVKDPSSSLTLRGLATNGTFLFMNDNGARIAVLNFDGTVLSTHTVSNLPSGNNQLAFSKGYIFARNGGTIYRIDLTDDSSTAVSVDGSYPLLSGDSWMTGNLFNMPDGRIGTVGSPGTNPFTVRLYTVSSDGLTFTWSQDISIASSWSTDNHGFASDGRFLVLISYNTGHRVYDLTTGTQYSSDSWDLRATGIGNPTFFTHDHINHRYIIGDYSDDNFVLYNDSIYNYEIGVANFTSYPINTTYNITKVTNITWQDSGISGSNNISVQLSVDGGKTWYNSTKNNELNFIVSGTSLVYRVIFNAIKGNTLTLDNLIINWTDYVAPPEPPPEIIINFPSNASVLADVTPLLNITLNGTANTLWYTVDGKSGKNILCTNCGGTIEKFMYFEEGSYTVRIYANNSVGTQSSNITYFTINMNKNYYDSFDDNSSVLKYGGVSWSPGNITYFGVPSLIYRPNISSSNVQRIVGPASLNIRGITTNGSVLFFNDGGSSIYVTDFSGNLLSTHTVSNLAATNNQLAYSSISKYIYSRNGATVYRVNITDNSSTAVTNVNSSTKPYLTGDSWMTGNLFDMPDGRIGTVSSPSTNPITIRLYSVSSDGLTLTWSEDITSSVTWSTDNHGFASDGTFLTFVSMNDGHRVYYISNGTQYYYDSWNLQPTGISNPTFVTHDQINHRYIIGDYDQNDFVIYNDSIYSYSIGSANFTSYPINTTQSIKQISNITWQTSGTNENNNISINLSVDGGKTWYNTTNGQGLTGFTPNKSLVYRPIFKVNESRNISLLDINISWLEPPDVRIVYPVAAIYNINITSMNYTVTVAGGESVSACWYSLNGIDNIPISCSSNITGIGAIEGNNTWYVYANDSGGAIGSASVSFSVDLSAPNITFLNQTDEDDLIVNSSHGLLQGQNLTIFVNVSDLNIDKVWIIVWNSVIGGVEKVKVFFTYLGGFLWVAKISTNQLWNDVYNYTIYANDTAGFQSNYSGNFSLLKIQSSINMTPNPSPGAGLVNVYGSINLTNSTYFGNYPVNIWLNGNLLLTSDLSNGVGNWWNPSWGYRKRINITNNNVTSVLESGYSFNFTIDTTGSKFLDNGDDLRVVYYNGTQKIELDRINTTAFDSTSTNIWFKVQNNISASSTDANYYVYYGNPYATSPPINTSKIYLFYDSFNDSSAWTAATGACSASSSQGNPIPSLFMSGSGTTDRCYSNNFDLPSTPYIIEADVYISSTEARGIRNIGFKHTSTHTNGYMYRLQTSGGDGGFFILNGAGAWSKIGSNDADVSPNTWYNLKLLIRGTNFTAWLNGAYRNSVVDATYSNTKIGTQDDTGADSDSYVDNYIVRKYIYPEPSSSLASEENQAESSAGTLLSHVDTSNSDFNQGIYSNISVNPGNLTLSGTNVTGNFSKIIDAGARVEWIRADWSNIGQSCSAVISYQDGDTNSFSGTSDTYIDGNSPTSNYGTENYFLVDSNPMERALLKFDVLGYGKNKIPFNSTINSANVSLDVYDSGDSVTIYEVLENWSENQATYNNRLTGIAWSSIGVAGSPSRSTVSEDTFSPSFLGVYNFSILNSFKRWTNQTSNNYGIVLNPGGSNGVGIRSRDFSTQSSRPKFIVNFSSSDCTGTRVFVRTSNDKITWTSWQEISKGSLISDSNNASRYLEYRVELSSFNESFKPYLQDITFNYTAIITNSSGWYNTYFSSPTTFGTYNVCVNTSFRTTYTNSCTNLDVYSSVAPNVFLIAPNNNQWFNYSSLNLTYNASDNNNDLANATLIINSQINQSNTTTVLNNQYNNFSINFGSGQYNWTVNITDSQNHSSIATQRTFYIDLENPNITLVYPLSSSSHNVASLNLSFNVTDNLDNVLNCSVVLDSSVKGTSSSNNNTNTNISSGILTAGTHYWNVTCIDESGRSTISPTWNFTIADSPPITTLISPTTNYLDADGNISFIYNASDDSGFINCSLYIDGVFNSTNKTSILINQNNTINVTGIYEGNHNWTVECFDLSSSSNKPSPRNFSVDLFYPLINLNLPLNGAVSNFSFVNFNFTVNDTFDSNLTCNLTINSLVVDSFGATNGSLTNRNILSLTDGLKYWNVSCKDDAGHLNTSNTRTINITESPRIYLNTSNGSSYTVNYLTLQYTPFDNTNLSSCQLYLDGTFNQSNSSNVINGNLNNFVLNDLSDGAHFWYVNCSDYIGLRNISETRVFYIDGNPPNITLYYPNGNNVYLDNISFNFTAKDAVDSNLTCNLTIDTTIEKYNFYAPNGSISNVSVFGIYDGFHTWYINCSDDAGNIGGSSIFNFTKLTPPEVSLIFPNNGTWFNKSTINLTYFTYDNEGILGALLIINESVNQTNSTSVLNGENNNFTITLADGFYSWNVNVTDVSGLNGTNISRFFYIDTQKPKPFLNNPNGSRVEDWNNVTFNFSAVDNLDGSIFCNLTLNGGVEYSGNITNSSNKIVYIPLADGNYTWNIICQDEAENINSSDSFNFTVIAPPRVTLDSPPNNNFTQFSNIIFYYTPYDAIGVTQCNIYLDGELNDTNNNPVANQQNNFIVSGIAEGMHNWTVNCTDSDNNWNWSAERIFYRDNHPPAMILNSPDNNSGIDFNKDRVYFNWTAVDALDNILQCNLTVDGIIRQPNVWLSNNTPHTEYVLTSVMGQGIHYWNVTCWDQLKNINTSELRKFNLTYPDFFVNSSEIILNETNPKENQSVIINATIHNLGGADVDNVTVRFYNGDPDSGGTQIGTDIFISISKFNQTNVSKTWISSIGNSQIFVIVDPPLATNGSLNESNESNNKAGKSFNVVSWHFFYGDILSFSDVVLANSANKTLINWDNFNAGNVYVTDYDSYVSWNNLQAIGKTKSGADSSSDFSEIDSLLNSTPYADSVYSIYTNSGVAKEELNLILFNRAINEIPIANSTNNSNFVTGILWDYSDDTGGVNGEFNATDKEDLIFVAPIRKSTFGTYGTYDYEIRVPAKLRNYKSPNLNSASFYVELA